MANFIYKITNQINNKIYCGFHSGEEDDNYFGSGVYLKRAIKKYGKENFKKEILEYCSLDSWKIKEQEWIKKLDCKSPKGMNLTDGGEGSPGKIVSLETREKQRKSMLGKHHTDETKEKIRVGNKGKKQPPEAIEKTRNARLGTYHKAETIEELRKIAKERFKIPENNPMFGKNHSEETLNKMKESHKYRPMIRCTYCNKIFSSAMYIRWHGDKCKKRGE